MGFSKINKQINKQTNKVILPNTECPMMTLMLIDTNFHGSKNNYETIVCVNVCVSQRHDKEAIFICEKKFHSFPESEINLN